MTRTDSLPFSAVVGQEPAKLALVLTALDRRIGGVLLRGDKGSAKSTLARGLAALLPGDAPFVELPLGATEDRVVGSIDLAAALTAAEKRFDPGLLHAVDGGILYVDEINLLPDHLVDVLLDVAASGVNRVEREGVSHSHPSRFVLIGSMNPEEGDLRPQLLDRFGLAVDVRTPADGAERVAALRRRLRFDADPAEVTAETAGEESELATRLAAARPATVPDAILEAVAGICAAAGAEGLRADLTICRAAAALAGWEGRTETAAADVRRVAAMALTHRARRDPLEPAGHDQQRLQEALDDHLGDRPDGGASDPGTEGGEPASRPHTGGAPSAGADQRRVNPGDGEEWDGPEERVQDPGYGAAPQLSVVDRSRRQAPGGRSAPSEGRRGRTIGDRRPDGPVTAVAVGATVRQAAARRAAAPEGALVEMADVRQAVREQRSANLVVIAVDASGSMGAATRMETAKGVVLSLLRDAYQRRDQVALVAFRGEGGEVLLRPTGSVEVARARLTQLPTGGRTPLAAGLLTALEVAGRAARRSEGYRPFLVVITDGRATAGPDGREPLAAALDAAAQVRRSGVDNMVIDVEGDASTVRLGLARDLAEAMGAIHVPLSELTVSAVDEAVRRAVLH
ncbi:MAG TPA: VWA domain-containing protein [Acidimicrobiales bacterium]|jgi:magnesium chelatase subunit D|nr:VWA domain-containing protein [Acidimicrobiales bacterium]